MPLQILPKPRKLIVPSPALKLRRLSANFLTKPKISPAELGMSVDEKTQMILDQIEEEANLIDEDETRDLWLDGVETFRKDGDIAALIELTKYRRKVVPLDEFMFGKTYLDLNEAETYPGVMEACEAIDTDNYQQAVLKGALGGGKTTTGNIMLARSIYKLSCMRHPQSTYGIQSRSSLVFTIQSIRISTAKKAVFDEFGNVIRHSPYFKTTYPFDPLITSQMIFREQNVTIMPVASSSTGAISMNVIGGVLDEMNFMQKIVKSKNSNADDSGSFDQAKQVYEAITRRRKSRFANRGKLPGTLFLISSSRFPDDFTEQMAAKAEMCGGDDPSIYVFSKSVWESKGRDKFLPEDFRVQVGNASIRSKVLEDGEDVHELCTEIRVPMDFYQQFKDDVDGSIRDFAGITTLSTRPFITRREAIYDCMRKGNELGFENIFEYEQYDLSLGIPRPIRERVRSDIASFRAVHIDLGLTRDAAGLSIGHISGQKLIERTDPATGITMTELLPTVAYDCIMRIVPPRNGEIEFGRIRELLLMLRDQYGLPIEFVTLDGFQSADCRQILRTLGFKSDYLSVEKVDPYRGLRDAIYDGRLYLPRHEFVASELASLEWVPSSTGNVNGDKVDHRANGSKDVADSVCGVATFLFSRRAAWSNVIYASDQQRRNVHRTVEDKPEQDKIMAHTGPMRKMTFRKSVFRRAAARK